MKINQSQNGFTLIELLVVVAIIALLSTVVLAGLAEARERARDTATEQGVYQLQVALELYRNDNGHYPIVGDEDTGVCIKDPNDSQSCSGFGSSGSVQTFYNEISDYYKPQFINTNRVDIGYNTYYGVVYKCDDYPDCSDASLYWTVSNPNTGKGSSYNASGGYIKYQKASVQNIPSNDD